MYKPELALNNLQWLKCNKIKPPLKRVSWYDAKPSAGEDPVLEL